MTLESVAIYSYFCIFQAIALPAVIRMKLPNGSKMLYLIITGFFSSTNILFCFFCTNACDRTFKKKYKCSLFGAGIGIITLKKMDVILLDFSKTFDALLHHRLLMKLYMCGILDNTHK